MSFDKVTPKEAFASLTQLGRQTQSMVAGLIEKMDARDKGTLHFAIAAMLSLEYTPETLSELIGVSQTTIGRWATGARPRSAPFRAWAVGILVSRLYEDLANHVQPFAAPRAAKK